MMVEVSGRVELAAPVRFWMSKENDAALQVTEDRIDIYMGQSKVGEIAFVSKNDLNLFFKQRGIEKR